MDDQEGFIYYCVGEPALGEARASIISLRRQMPFVPILVHSDKPEVFDGLGAKLFKTSPEYEKPKRIELLINSPFQRTVYLDSDTYLVADCSELFELLNKKDLYFLPTKTDIQKTRYPTYRHYNSGVIILNKTRPALDFLRIWQGTFENMLAKRGNATDEEALKLAIARTGFKPGTLPARFNFRVPSDKNRRKAVILHGHPVV